MAKLTHKEQIVSLLSDGRWHSTHELILIAWRYSARLHDLRKLGYIFEKKNDPTHPTIEWWKLIDIPSELKTRPTVQQVMF